MAIQPCNLSYDDERCGIALVDTVSGHPLPLSWKAFDDMAEASEFLAWAPMDIRKLTGGALFFLVKNWRERPRGKR